MNHNSPYLLEDLTDVLMTVLTTACVRDAVPVSVVLVADSGTAKSKVIKQYNGKGVHITDSFSSQGLFQLMQTDPESHIRFILVPDLNPTLSRQQKTVTATVANLLSLTMDGTCRIDDGRQEKLVKHKPIGLITAVTPDIYQMQTRKWFALGLTRRILPIYYQYRGETIRKLLDIVKIGKINGGDFPPIEVEISAQCSPVIPDSMAGAIEVLAQQLSINLGSSRGKDSDGKIKWWVKKIVPISPTVILRTLAQSHAIRKQVVEVGPAQLEFLNRFIDFTNPAQPRQI